MYYELHEILVLGDTGGRFVLWTRNMYNPVVVRTGANLNLDCKCIQRVCSMRIKSYIALQR
jgi:hypothetical protein